jgi:8-oxo-dGTP diphosphatase
MERPGRKIEAGETPEECIIREVREESGLEITHPRLCGLLMFPGFKGADWYVFTFTASNFSGELIDSPEGELRWIADEVLEALPLWPSDHIFFPWLKQERFFSAKFVYDGDVFLDHEVVFYGR